MKNYSRMNTTKSHIQLSTLLNILYLLFFFSGTASLIYQVTWQRMLFTRFGVDLDSITVIVSVFMLGLGMGGLLGGVLADKHTKTLLMLYICIELAIAIFGFFSPHFIGLVDRVAIHSNEFVTAISCFIILIFPTLLMGATFPLLVTHVANYYQNIGQSVGNLYFANTLGGAVGVFLSGFVLLNFLSLIGVINCAVAINITVAFIAFIIFRR